MLGYEGEQCTIMAEGHHLAFDPDRTDLRRWRGRNISIASTVAVPYRCFGGLIFALQRAHAGRIGFISQPAPPEGQPEEAAPTQ
jgi:hypothetical protein